MRKCLVPVALSVAVLMTAGSAVAQEATIHHGFLFFAGEKYTVDEKTFGVYDDGHLFENLVKDNPEALDLFHSYETWHTMGIVFTGASIAAFVFGGVYYMFEKEFSENLGESTGIISFAAGGGLLALGFIWEFISWGRISSAAETYNKRLIDEGPALELDLVPTPCLAFLDDGAHLALTWRF